MKIGDKIQFSERGISGTATCVGLRTHRDSYGWGHNGDHDRVEFVTVVGTFEADLGNGNKFTFTRDV